MTNIGITDRQWKYTSRGLKLLQGQLRQLNPAGGTGPVCGPRLLPELQLNRSISVDVSGPEDRLQLSLLPADIHVLIVVDESCDGCGPAFNLPTL